MTLCFLPSMGLLDDFPASAGRDGRRLDFQFRAGRSGTSEQLAGHGRQGRLDAEFLISGLRLWDASFLISYSRKNDFWPPAVQGLPDGFMVSA